MGHDNFRWTVLKDSQDDADLNCFQPIRFVSGIDINHFLIIEFVQSIGILLTFSNRNACLMYKTAATMSGLCLPCLLLLIAQSQRNDIRGLSFSNCSLINYKSNGEIFFKKQYNIKLLKTVQEEFSANVETKNYPFSNMGVKLAFHKYTLFRDLFAHALIFCLCKEQKYSHKRRDQT